MYTIEEENNEFMIETEDVNISDNELETLSLDDSQQIEGFFSFVKKIAKKASGIVKSVSNIPVLGSLIPPQVTMGANFLNSLSKAEQKTGKKVKFGVNATKTFYSNGFVKGRVFERKRLLKQLKKMG